MNLKITDDRFELIEKLNENKEVVDTIREGLKRTGGYCPCRLNRTEEYKCMCEDFRQNIKAGQFCHCGLYIKDEI